MLLFEQDQLLLAVYVIGIRIVYVGTVQLDNTVQKWPLFHRTHSKCFVLNGIVYILIEYALKFYLRIQSSICETVLDWVVTGTEQITICHLNCYWSSAALNKNK